MPFDSRMPKQDYSILIIGINCHPTHIDRFIRNLKQNNPSTQISLLTNREPSVYPKDVHECILFRFVNW